MIVESISVFSEHPYGSPDLNELKTVAHRILHDEGWAFDLKIIIVDDPEIRRLNRLFLSVDEVTDVLAFSTDEDETSGGEIYVNLDQARLQAIEASESVQRALNRLLIHGVLHLGGWNDAADADRKKMLLYGERYLSAAENRGTK